MSEITVPYLAEHQAPDNPYGGANPGYQPDDDEKRILQLVDALYSKAKKYRKRYDQRWIDWYKMFRGRQWKEVRPSYRSSEVMNLIFEAIQSMVPVLVDSKPRLEFLPTIPTQGELADILNKVAANDWEHNNWILTLIELLYDSHFYGTAFGYVGFNPKSEMGLGAIEFESTDTFYFFPDPQARDINGKRTKHIITAEPTDISEIKKQYPDKAQWVAADVIDFAQGDKADVYQVMFKSPTDSKLIVEGPSGYDSIAKNQTLKITLYTKDDDLEEEEEIELHQDGTPVLDETGNPVTHTEQKLKYPHGRKTVVAGGVLLEDGEMEFEDGQFPFVRLQNYCLPREFWGVGEVENLDPPQKTFNKLLAYLIDCLSLMANPIYIVDDTSGVDTDNLFNKPGLVIEKHEGSEVRRESGVDVPTFVLPMLDRYRRYFDGISGQTDLSKGIEPSNVIAAEAIEDLQQAQQTRLRLKATFIDAFLKDFGKLYLSRVFQFYSVPRIVRITGDTNADQYFYFHVESVAQTNEAGETMTQRVAHITTPDRGQTKKYIIEGDFDIRVATGSSLPMARSAAENRALELFDRGIIDAEEVLKSMDYPNYEMVLQRVQQQKSQQQEMQMKMAVQMQQAKVGEMGARAKEMSAKADKAQVDAEATAKMTAVKLTTPQQIPA